MTAESLALPTPYWVAVKANTSAQPDRERVTAADSTQEAEELKQLMLGYQNADREAAAELVRRLSPKLGRFLAGPVYTRSFADDMLQECWLRIHRSRAAYRPGTPVLPWVYAIARHTRIDSYRRRRKIDTRETALEQISDTDRRASTPAKTPDRDLWKLVERLPAGQREVILMLKVSGMTLEETARATGSTVGAVKQKAHRAYVKLREMIESQARERVG